MTHDGQKRVLIMEDDPSTLEVISDTMTEEGYKTFPFNKVDHNCVNTLLNGKIDLILLDLGLFNFNSVVIMDFLKNNGAAKDVPIIVVSGKPVKEIERAAASLKASNWIRKPFKLDELIRKVRVVLGDVVE